jgi:hypothetical protein
MLARLAQVPPPLLTSSSSCLKAGWRPPSGRRRKPPSRRGDSDWHVVSARPAWPLDRMRDRDPTMALSPDRLPMRRIEHESARAILIVRNFKLTDQVPRRFAVDEAVSWHLEIIDRRMVDQFGIVTHLVGVGFAHQVAAESADRIVDP